MPKKAKAAPLQSTVESVETLQNRTPQIISLDLGNAYTNMKTDAGETLDWRSVQGKVGDANRMKDLPFDHTLNIGGEWWVFGEAAYTYTPRTLEDYPATSRYTSDWYRRLFFYALHRAYGLRVREGDSWFEPQVILSIPAGQFNNDAVVQKVRSSLAGEHTLGTTLGYLRVRLHHSNLFIIPEGAGSFVAASMDSPTAGLDKGIVLVVDVGYLTTDILGYRGGDYMPELAESDSEAGMRVVARAVARDVYAQTGVELRPEEVDPYTLCDALVVRGKAIPIKEARARAMVDLGKRVVGFITRVATRLNVSNVLLTGGGAEALHPILQAQIGMPTLVAPNARRANVEGAYLLLKE